MLHDRRQRMEGSTAMQASFIKAAKHFCLTDEENRAVNAVKTDRKFLSVQTSRYHQAQSLSLSHTHYGGSTQKMKISSLGS